jgi:hydrogenase nickel incorporation protein HypA/HybF
VHEVSLMMSIMDIVIQTAEKEKAESVVCISLEVGKKSGVVADALEFAFDMVTKGTIAENARLDMEVVPLKGECLNCGHLFENEEFLICDKCGHFGKVLSGQELNIKSIEVK